MAEEQEKNPQESAANDDILKQAEEIAGIKPEEAPAAEEKAAEEAKAEEAQPIDPKDAELQKLQAENAALKEQANAAADKFVRLMAEFDNFRRRTAKEQLDLIETANGKLLEKLSEVLDNFERAAAPENNQQKDFDAFSKGIQMIHDQFYKILTDAGLVQIDPVGQEFDPNEQEALMNQPSDTVPESHVVQVFQKGYKLKNKLLKTAKVIVSSGSASK
ncbi:MULTISPECIES: nucleotide exchange factor GrpE [Hallerella]|uniref:Protein GrpE n=1 Tax=Hallerella succinigenes TaxID=1896222 RepID=A0A2M9AA95_9BACT|nr:MULTISPECIES: nucleotide exchange factor GrpE [Hallerella]MBS7391476.1 nucleotide exchange factor GrpE [Fibrobacter sp.]MCI6872561.1 nucleotide exchange factor GrpE [Hallerella sp.]MDD6092945.1 nucleotide exchange factor GrpE [Hallerella succinigenes]MDY5029451.1 nucleotide exchange factor GrpE [Hallerella succinigenes]PJJ42629.1 molecular chaperone GrpE [Hallerella succinigenes]